MGKTPYDLPAGSERLILELNGFRVAAPGHGSDGGNGGEKNSVLVDAVQFVDEPRRVDLAASHVRLLGFDRAVEVLGKTRQQRPVRSLR